MGSLLEDASLTGGGKSRNTYYMCTNIISRSQQSYVCGRVLLRLSKDLRGEQKEEGVNGPRTAMLLISIWFVSK